MQLSNCELLPGVIVDTTDPLKLGRIKCVIPSYVDASFSNENMPWVRPLGMVGHQSFSKMVKGYKVWVLVNKSNYNEYWYFPFFELNDVAKSYLDSVYDDDQPEILIAQSNGGNNVSETYDKTNGFSTKIGQNHIDLHPDGKIELLGNDGVIRIDGYGSKIQIGNTSNIDQQAVLGNKLVEVLNNLKSAFSELKTVSKGILSPLEPGFSKAESALTNIENILSDNITIN